MADKILSPEEWLAQQGGATAADKTPVMSPEEWAKHQDDSSYDMSEYEPSKAAFNPSKRAERQGAGPTRFQKTMQDQAGHMLTPVGAAEAGLQALTGFAGGIPAAAGAVAGAVLPGPEGQAGQWARKALQASTYEPRTESGKLASEMLSTFASAPGELIKRVPSIITDKEYKKRGMKPPTPEDRAQQENVAEFAGEVVPAVAQAAVGASGLMRPTARLTPKNLAEESALKARESGYVIPPDNALTGYGGKIKTQQDASVKNQVVTNAKAAQEIGLPKDAELSEKAFTELKDKYSKPYADVSKLGDLDVTGVTLPSGVKVKRSKDPLAMSGKDVVTVDAAELVRQWKQSNADARGYFNAYARDANPETQAKAFKAKSESQQMERLIRKVAKEKGDADLYDALKEARVNLAKVHNVEAATNTATGNVDAAKLARNKYLTGELKDIQSMQKIAPKSVKTPESIGAHPSISPLDTAVAGMEATGALAAGKPGLAAATLAQLTGRPLTRKYLLSDAYQQKLTQDTAARKKAALDRAMGASLLDQREEEKE